MLLFCAGAMAMIAISVWYWSSYLVRPRSCGGPLTACKSNLKNVGTALEMYSADNHGAYPSGLSVLTPNYLKYIPECPAASKDTYSPSYTHGRRSESPVVWCPEHVDNAPCANYWRRLEREADLFKTRAGRYPVTLDEMTLETGLLACPYGGVKFGYSRYQESYFVFCQGSHHVRVSVPTDRPAYDSAQGLIER